MLTWQEGRMPTSKWGWCGAVALAFSVCAALPAPAAADGRNRNGNGGGGYSVADTTYSTVAISGFDVTRNADYYYSGIYYALNRDLSRDGFLVRVLGVRGFYEYDGEFAWGADQVHANYWIGDAMIGYQWVRGGTDISALIGVEYQDHQLSENDTSNPLRGSEVGFKVAADIESNGNGNSPWYYALGGSYSTAFDSYYALGRIGHKFGRFTVGPEAWALGDVSGDAQRLGGFIAWDVKLGDTLGNISFSVGHQFADGDDGDSFEGGRNFDEGTYATAKFSLAFK
jgi:Cellulose biosynthesis protein BcsS